MTISVSSFLNRLHTLLTTLLLSLLVLGPIPKHVGFVMDGNRRYAKKQGRRGLEGHGDGFKSLKRVLELCGRLNIKAVSIYAFSIDNFSRPKDEVEAIMDLAKRAFTELVQEGEFVQKHQVKINFVGQRHLLPVEVQELVRSVEQRTARNTNAVLNVCCPYTSRDEIVTAIKTTVEEGGDSLSPITSEDVYANLGTARGVSHLGMQHDKLDILVRTSDVKRLSDFMMWQSCEDTQLHFVKTYWPDFGLTDMLPILLGWQQKQWLRMIYGR